MPETRILRSGEPRNRIRLHQNRPFSGYGHVPAHIRNLICQRNRLAQHLNRLFPVRDLYSKESLTGYRMCLIFRDLILIHSVGQNLPGADIRH